MVGTLVMAPKSVTFRCFLEIYSANPTTLHFQCFCILLLMIQSSKSVCTELSSTVYFLLLSPLE